MSDLTADPDTPDLWVQRDSNNTLYVMWKVRPAKD